MEIVSINPLGGVDGVAAKRSAINPCIACPSVSIGHYKMIEILIVENKNWSSGQPSFWSLGRVISQ